MLNLLSMGGYAVYVWPAYALVAVTLLACAVAVKQQAQRINKLLTTWFEN